MKPSLQVDHRTLRTRTDRRIGPCPEHLQGGHGRSTPSYIVTLANTPIIFKVGLQGLTAQSTMEEEVVGAALTIKKEAVFCSNIMLELGFDESSGSVPRAAVYR